MTEKKKLDLVQLSQAHNLDIWVALSYLCKSKKGVTDFICNELYKFGDHIVEFFLPQICNVLLKDPEPHSLFKFLMDKCSSLHLALKIFFWFQAAVEDNVYPKTRTNWLWHECEMAAVNSKSLSVPRMATMPTSPSLETVYTPPFESPRKIRHSRSVSMPDMSEVTLSSSAPTSSSSASDIHTAMKSKSKRLSLAEHTVEEGEEEPKEEDVQNEPYLDQVDKLVIKQNHSSDNLTSLEKPTEGEPVPEAEFIQNKKLRHQFFHSQLQFLVALTDISSTIKQKGFKTKTENNKELYSLLKQVQNDIVAPSLEIGFETIASQGKIGSGLYFPICRYGKSHQRVIRLLAGDSFCLSSRDRVPYMLFVETITVEGPPDVTCKDSEDLTTSIISTPVTRSNKDDERKPKFDLNDSLNVIANESPALKELDESTPVQPDTIVEAIEKIMTINREQLMPGEEEWVLMHAHEEEQSSTLRLAYPELWAEKEERIRKTSPYGRLPNWALYSVIVKSGDDLRQEQLAVQLIETFYKIFKKAELPLWLYSYNVIATSSNSGLIETIPDAISIDALKKRIPNVKTLEDYFISAYGEKTSMKFLQAQRNFVESLAAYSLVCYLLQIKDRHSGNILLDKEGHLIHIDYGFMLTSSPGSLGFETAPFKLTDEFIKLMGGDMSDMSSYFKLLLIRGFLEVRKHHQKIILLVEMLLPGYKMKCFARRESVIRELKDRFQLQLSDKECVTFIGELIKESARNWRTGSYDNYQYYLNGILA